MSVAVALMMRLEVLPVTMPDGENSSPSVPEGTGGPKSKCERQLIVTNDLKLTRFYDLHAPMLLY